MIQFTYSFCIALLHSFWQSALLLLLYVTVDRLIHRNNAPLAKRNFLYAAVATQLILFILTFSIFFFDTAGAGNFAVISQNITGYLGNENIQSLAPWIFSLYIFVVACKLMKAVYNWFQFKKLYQAGLQKPSVELKLFTELKAYQFGIKRKVKIWLSSSVHTPVTFGFFKPIILLPVTLVNNISTEQAETLILHELTHIRTNDYLLNWFLLSAEMIFFFNPFVTRLCKEIRLEREKNCDIHVMAFEYSPALYAQTLLQAERMKQLVPDFQLAAVNRKRHLLQRIQYFTSDKIVNKTLRFNIVAPLIGLVLLLMLSAAVLFRSGNSALPIQSTTDIHYLPFSDYIMPDADFSKQVITENVIDKTSEDKTELKQPAIENKIKPAVLPVSKPAEQIIEELVKPVDINFALPVTTTENDAAQQIIIKEEGSGSASIKIYYLSFENDKWILKPEWIITAKQIVNDSLNRKIDTLKSSLRKFYPAEQ